MSETKNTSLAQGDYGTQVIARVGEMIKSDGLTLPKNYQYVNAVKATMLHLAEVTDKAGRPALEVCTPASITASLYKMVTKGLDVSKGQGYFVIRGNKLCFDDQYFGKITQIRRMYPKWSFKPHVIYANDEFEYSINPVNGYTKLVKHIQHLENRDPNNWIGGYVYLPTADGDLDLFLMSRREIEAAWSQGRNGTSVHLKFLEKMVGKTLLNSGATSIINPDDSCAPMFSNDGHDNEEEEMAFESYEEVDVDVPSPSPEPAEEIPTVEPVEAEEVMELDFDED